MVALEQSIKICIPLKFKRTQQRSREARMVEVPSMQSKRVTKTSMKLWATVRSSAVDNTVLVRKLPHITFPALKRKYMAPCKVIEVRVA